MNAHDTPLEADADSDLQSDLRSDLDGQFESPLAEAARAVAANPKVQDALPSVVDLAMTACACFGASVTLVRTTGGAETTARSCKLIEQADELQYQFDEGPCLRAAEQGGAYLIVDTATDPRWPVWGPAVAAMGLRSVAEHLSVHRRPGPRRANLYYEDITEFADDEVETAKVVAAHASVALARIRSERDLWRAIDSRHLIGQAQGILMERFRLTPERAFAVLRRHSQQHNIKLHEIASTLVRTGHLPADREPDPAHRRNPARR